MPDPDPVAAVAAFVYGDYVPIGRASVSVLDWGFNKSDVTYDVVHVWHGAFFRLDDHLARFAASMAALHMQIPHDAAEQARILAGCVQRAGLRDAYVALVATPAAPLPGMPRRPSRMLNRSLPTALPSLALTPRYIHGRGPHPPQT